jgi:uracil-DNA glycosylase family 4
VRDAREEAAEVAREARVALQRERDRLKWGAAGAPAPAAGAPTKAATAAATATAAAAVSATAADPEVLSLPGFEPPPPPKPLPAPGAFVPAAAGPGAGLATEMPLELRADLPHDLPALQAMVAGCRKCALCETRTKTVFADGTPLAKLMFVGEAPGRDEDLRGLPFVGRAGQLLDKMIEAIEMKRDEVYICNVLKCRPPDNRTPAPDEVEKCRPFLEQQLALVRPVVVCALGLSAAQALLETKATMSSMRGKTFSWRGIPLIPTYHPAALLRNPGLKRDAWIDLQRVRDLVRSVG